MNNKPHCVGKIGEKKMVSEHGLLNVISRDDTKSLHSPLDQDIQWRLLVNCVGKISPCAV